MAHYKREINVGDSPPLENPKFWVSHRMGPFLIHTIVDCDPEAMACKNDYDNLIEQGFASCPRCGEG